MKLFLMQFYSASFYTLLRSRDRTGFAGTEEEEARFHTLPARDPAQFVTDSQITSL